VRLFLDQDLDLKDHFNVKDIMNLYKESAKNTILHGLLCRKCKTNDLGDTECGNRSIQQGIER